MSLLDTASLVVTPNGTKASKLYSVVPSSGAGDLDVTRATTATRVNSSGLIESVASNVPRLDYTNGTCPSILVEPQRTNSFLYSEQFNNAYWGKYQTSVTSNATVSPDGNLTADTVAVTTGTGGSIFLISPITGTYTVTVFFKAETSNLTIIEVPTIGDVNINLSTGTFTTTGSVTGAMKSFANGWYRCTATFTGTAIPYISFGITGIAGQTASLWGAQLEAGSYATSYIPTTSASVTRNADVISKTGISSLIGQTEGTVLFDGIADITNPNGAILIYLGSSDGSGAFDYSTYLKFSGNNLNLTVYSGGVNYVNSTSTQTYTNKQNIKVAFSYKNNDFICYANGVQLFTDTTGVVSTNLSSIALGFYPPNIPFNQYNGNINLTALWKTRLTNTQLAQLTTI